MKSIFLTLLSLFTLLTVTAQELTVKSFVQTNDAIARTRNVMGTDGNVCAAVIVRIPTENAKFDGGFILGRSYKNGEYILDMQSGAAQMRVSAPGFNTIDVKFREYIGSTLQSKTTYMLTINMPQIGGGAQPKMQTLNIKVTPSDAMVQIDGEIVDGNSVPLQVGTHRYNVAARGYNTQEGTIEVKENYPAKLLIELDRKTASLDVPISEHNPLQLSYQNPVQQQNSNGIAFTVGDVSFTMMPVEGGTFMMGATPEMTAPWDDESPVHKVTLNGYYIGETEVTQALWMAVMEENPSCNVGDNLPVEYVSWNECQKFITKLNNMTGKRFRLPTEAEWEFAARGGNKSHNTQYSGSNDVDDIAWFYDNGEHETHPVKTKVANELGIYDMSGNVWEWCSDLYGSYSATSQTNPTGRPNGDYHVYRGGSFDKEAGFCRSSCRYNESPDFSSLSLGLRLALSE